MQDYRKFNRAVGAGSVALVVIRCLVIPSYHRLALGRRSVGLGRVFEWAPSPCNRSWNDLVQGRGRLLRRRAPQWRVSSRHPLRPHHPSRISHMQSLWSLAQSKALCLLAILGAPKTSILLRRSEIDQQELIKIDLYIYIWFEIARWREWSDFLSFLILTQFGSNCEIVTHFSS